MPDAPASTPEVGHERGAFTGAVQAKPGLFEAARGGTVLLDEIGELPLALQAKLLPAVEVRQILRVGSVRPIDLDVRFLAASHVDLDQDVARGAFRDPAASARLERSVPAAVPAAPVVGHCRHSAPTGFASARGLRGRSPQRNGRRIAA